MERQMNDLMVRVSGDEIIIEQKDPPGNHDDMIVVTPDHVELLCGWLLDAKHKLEANSNRD